jgi:sulfate adenylyltransferase subunit 1 (EFTu-like GTPase family)
VDIVPFNVIPISARDGENIATRFNKVQWKGVPTVPEVLDRAAWCGTIEAGGADGNLNFVYNRDKDRVNLIFCKHGTKPITKELEGGWL